MTFKQTDITFENNDFVVPENIQDFKAAVLVVKEKYLTEELGLTDYTVDAKLIEYLLNELQIRDVVQKGHSIYICQYRADQRAFILTGIISGDTPSGVTTDGKADEKHTSFSA